MRNELNSRQWALYNALKEQGDEWKTQAEIAYELSAEFPEYEFKSFNTFHDENARHIMTADIRAINDSGIIQKIIISGGKGIKIANKEEFDRYIRKEIMAAVRRLLRAKRKAAKGNRDGQMKIPLGEYERDTIKAFIDSDKSTGERLRAAREKAGLKAVDVVRAADIKGFDASMLSKYEHGYAMPTERQLAKIAEICGTTPEYILFGEISNETETSEYNGLQAVKNG